MKKKWSENQSRILFLLIYILSLVNLQKLPYFSVLLSNSAIGLLVWLAVIILFNLKSNWSALVAVFSIVLSGMTVFLNLTDSANHLANLAYYLFLTAMVQLIFERRRGKKKT